MGKINGVKVFSASKFTDRDVLGDRVTEWIQANRDKKIVDTVVTQSSDAAFHCITITLFYGEVVVEDAAQAELARVKPLTKRLNFKTPP